MTNRYHETAFTPAVQRLQARAKARGIPYTRLIREALEGAVAGPAPGATDRRTG